jgi:predicted secreted protein
MFDTNFDDYCTCDFNKKLGKDKAVDPGNQDINIYYKRLVKSLLNRQQFKVS